MNSIFVISQSCNDDKYCMYLCSWALYQLYSWTSLLPSKFNRIFQRNCRRCNFCLKSCKLDSHRYPLNLNKSPFYFNLKSADNFLHCYRDTIVNHSCHVNKFHLILYPFKNFFIIRVAMWKLIVASTVMVKDWMLQENHFR